MHTCLHLLEHARGRRVAAANSEQHPRASGRARDAHRRRSAHPPCAAECVGLPRDELFSAEELQELMCGVSRIEPAALWGLISVDERCGAAARECPQRPACDCT